VRPASADDHDGVTGESISRTLILGIDAHGTIMQCGQHAPGAGEPAPQDILGTHISTLLADCGEQHEQALDSLLHAVRARQERTSMLCVKAEQDATRDAVVTVKPMWTKADEPLALMLIRVALPAVQRFSDPALMRRAMLDDALTRVGGTLDFDQVARELVNVVVPAFANAAGVLLLESVVGADELAPTLPDGSAVLRRLAVAADDDNPDWHSAFPTGEILTYPPSTPYTRCMRTGRPVLEPHFEQPDADRLARAWRRKPVSDLLADVSMVLLPLAARDGSPLGFIVCTRMPDFRRFDAYDVEIGTEFSARASIFIENARKYSRERATALTLQRSLLPTRLTTPSTVEVRHRYLPGSKLIEVGGDWYESIALPGARVALVVGDVAGHGVRAAITMGRLRTALHTLAALEMRPTEALQQLDELMTELGQREPHFATCVYAVYDATTGTCEVASAGHLPPLLLGPEGSEFLTVPPAPPLGVSTGTIESREFTVADGSLFVLYTDGLVENRGQDLDDGLSRLQSVFGPEALHRPLEELAKLTLDGAYSDHYRDDIALLIARLSRIPEDHVASWKLTAEPEAVRRARSLVRERLRDWQLEQLTFTTELLVSELITNAYWHATGRIELRLLKEKCLTVEVHDDSAALPRLRNTGEEDENGRGLQIVSRLAQRWGTRRTAAGKVVWCEQPLPGGDEDELIPAWPGEELHR
jgi:serine phosphatase RsbU (regulator of sigma subunit)/anti-sigma regulatory factor (Ser/Thr protein kinase)